MICSEPGSDSASEGPSVSRVFCRCQGLFNFFCLPIQFTAGRARESIYDDRSLAGAPESAEPGLAAQAKTGFIPDAVAAPKTQANGTTTYTRRRERDYACFGSGGSSATTTEARDASRTTLSAPSPSSGSSSAFA